MNLHDFSDMGQHSFAPATQYEIGATHDAWNGARDPVLTGVKNYQVKDGNLITSAQVYVPATGRYLFISVKTPIVPTGPEIGWGWSDLKKSAKGVVRKATKVAKKHANKALKKIVKSKQFKKVTKKMSSVQSYVKAKASNVYNNPYVSKIAQGAAVAAAMYVGVPPSVTMAATGLLFNAMKGDAPSLAQVANIAKEAAAGYGPAVKAKALMSAVYQGGLKEMQPYIDKAKVAKAEAKGYLEAGQAKALQAAATVKAQAAKVPGAFTMPGMPSGLFPFNLPGTDLGEPIVGYVSLDTHNDKSADISGWYYNTPYRSNIEAKSLDVFGKQKNPFHILRGAYHSGLRHSR